MRLLPVVVLLTLVMSPSVVGQTNTIYTAAGNGLGGSFITWGDGGNC
jgi:hypothetical protein